MNPIGSLDVIGYAHPVGEAPIPNGGSTRRVPVSASFMSEPYDGSFLLRGRFRSDEYATLMLSGLQGFRGRYYYEVVLMEPGPLRLGFGTEKAAITGLGAGVCPFTWMIDGFNNVKLHEALQPYNFDWLDGDIVGLAIDFDSGMISCLHNSPDLSPCFVVSPDLLQHGVFPVISSTSGPSFILNIGESPFMFLPDGYQPVSSCHQFSQVSCEATVYDARIASGVLPLYSCFSLLPSEPNDGTGHLRASACLSFPTIVFEQFSISPSVPVYFEVDILNDEYSQIGIVETGFVVSETHGVGDDIHSWGVDGFRNQIFHGGCAGRYVQDDRVRFRGPCTVGIGVNVPSGQIWLRIGNSNPFVVVSDLGRSGPLGELYPAVSATSGLEFTVRFGGDFGLIQNLPAGFSPVSSVPTSECTQDISSFCYGMDSSIGERVSLEEVYDVKATHGRIEVAPTWASSFPSLVIDGLRCLEGKYYFEVQIVGDGLCQIGFANESFSVKSNNGVGDDAHSWAVDGYRQGIWHQSRMQSIRSRWAVGDVVVLAVDMDARKMYYSFNSDSLEFMFNLDSCEFVAPAASCSVNPRCILRFNMGFAPMKFRPAGFLPFSEILKRKPSLARNLNFSLCPLTETVLSLCRAADFPSMLSRGSRNIAPPRTLFDAGSEDGTLVLRSKYTSVHPMLWPFRLAHHPVVQKPFFEMTVFEHPKWRLDDVSLAASAGSSSSNDPFVSLYLFPSNSFDEKQSPSLPLALLAFHVDDGEILIRSSGMLIPLDSCPEIRVDFGQTFGFAWDLSDGVLYMASEVSDEPIMIAKLQIDKFDSRQHSEETSVSFLAKDSSSSKLLEADSRNNCIIPVFSLASGNICGSDLLHSPCIGINLGQAPSKTGFRAEGFSFIASSLFEHSSSSPSDTEAQLQKCLQELERLKSENEDLKRRLHTRIPEVLCCPISMEILEDPVVATDGFLYEKKYITEWLAKSRTSPSTGAPLSDIHVIPVFPLRAYLQDLHRHGLTLTPGEDSEKPF